MNQLSYVTAWLEDLLISLWDLRCEMGHLFTLTLGYADQADIFMRC